VSILSEVFCGEETLCASENGVLVGVVGTVFGGDLQDGRDGGSVRVKHIPDLLGYILRDENDVNVWPFDERLETLFDVGEGRVLVHNHEVGISLHVPLADSA